MPESIEIARLLRAGTSGFVAGCRVSKSSAPTLGALVRARVDNTLQVYGLIHDIHIDDDGLVRQLVTADHVSPEVIEDNRERRIVPVEISVLSVGYEMSGQIRHLLPPRPPLSLDLVYLCDGPELLRFTSAGRLGYLRHILQAEDVSIADVLSAHIEQASTAHKDGGTWRDLAIREVITLLRDDYSTLVTVLGALNEVV